MPYSGTAADVEALRNALDYLKRRNISWPALQKDYAAAIEEGKVPGFDKTFKPVSRPTLTNYSTLDKASNPSRGVASIFNFLESSPVYQTPHLNFAGINAGGDEAAAIVYAMARFFSAPQGHPPAHLEFLLNDRFEIFSPLRPGANDEFYVRSLVSFKRKKAADLLEYEEVYKIDDLTFFGGPIHNVYSGFLFQLGGKLLIFSKSETMDFRLLVIHHLQPGVTGSGRNVKVDVAYGTLLTVANSQPGPHLGSKFILRRIQDDDTTRQIVRKVELDDISRLYFY